MKINTHKLLVFLYFSQDNGKKVSYSTLYELFPDLSPGGVRSGLFSLKKKRLVTMQPHGKTTNILLSQLGEHLLKQTYGCLSPGASDNSFHCLVLTQPPPQDPQFRRLRRLLAVHHFLCLQRNVYLYQGAPPQEILFACRQEYFSSVFFIEVGKWHTENAGVLPLFHQSYSDVFSTLSGISTVIDRMIKQKDRQTLPIYQSKVPFFSVYQQLFSLMIQEAGVLASDKKLKNMYLSLANMLFSHLFLA